MTALVRWQPYREMGSLSDVMDRMLSRSFFRPYDLTTAFWGATQAMPVDIAENAQGFTVKASVPGVKPEELDIEREGRTVEVIIGDLPPCPADPSLLKQVFVNLISNAVKFTTRPPYFKSDVSTLDPAEPTQLALKGRNSLANLGVTRSGGHKHAYAPYFLGCLRTGTERNCECSANKTNKLPPSHCRPKAMTTPKMGL